MAPPPFREPLDVFIAHTGQRIVADRAYPGFNSVETFKQWIAGKSGIEKANVLLMTTRGKPPKLEAIMKEEDEIFLFDMGLFTLSDGGSGNIPQLAELEPYLPPDFPSTIAEGSSPKAWERLFHKRSYWARELANDTVGISRSVLKLNTEIGIVQRSCMIAVQGVKTHMEKTKSNYEDALDWARDIEQEQSYALFHCVEYLDKLSKITAIPEVGSCLRSAKLNPILINASGSRPRVTLQDFVNPEEVKKASDLGGVSSNRFGNRINTMIEDFEVMFQTAEDISARFHQDVIESSPSVEPQIIQMSAQIGILLEKIQRDHRQIESMPNIYNAPEMAATQADSQLPSLVTAVTGVNQLLRQMVQRKNQITMAAVKYMQKVSLFETKAAAVRQQSPGLDIDDGSREAFILVDFVVQLPSVYGSLLVECYRRNEWSQKRAIESSSTKGKAGLSVGEQKRRDSWAMIVGDFVNPDVLDEMALRSDIRDTDWPKVTKDDLSQYLGDIQNLQGLDKEVREFEKQVKSLEKGRSRKAKGFKNGSLRDATAMSESVHSNGTVHDAPFSDLPHVEIRRLEEKLKNSESRNARLEIMLQRQEMEHQAKLTDGVTFGNMTAPGSEQQKFNRSTDSAKVIMPKDTISGPFSQSSPQVLAELVREEDDLAKQIRDVRIENKSLAEQLAAANEELQAKVDPDKVLQNQSEEAISTKHGLLKNLEARQRESAEERRTLDTEMNKLKAKLEEAEEEIGRRAKTSDTDGKTKELELAMDQMRKDAAAEVQKAQGQIDFLQSDYTKHREKVNELERRLQQISEEKEALEIKLAATTRDIQNLHESKEKYSKALQAALQYLTTDVNVPVEYDALVEAVESNAQKSSTKLAATNDALEKAEADRRCLKTAVYDFEKRLALKERESIEAHEKSAAAGAIAKAQLSDLTKNLQIREAQLEELSADQTTLSKRLDTCADRAVEITSRLHSHVTGLLRFLDQAGFAVGVEEGRMIIQRAPKAVGDSTMFNEASRTENGSASAQSPTKSILDAFADEAILAWAKQQESDVEARQFGKLLQTVDTFDITIIGEAIVKRLKETEHTARKWHREARNYRERMHRAQSDAHDKIAYRAFKSGDLALFLPTRGQVARSWAAFNVGAPHYFLREQDSHNLETRDWLLARISKVDERVVDLSKTITGLKPLPDTRSIGETSEGGASIDDDNPFELSDGLRWYLLDAAEEKPGAPNILGPSKTTVASAKVDAKGSIRVKNSPDGEGATKTLTRSLDSRRSSTNSKKSIPAASHTPAAATHTSEHVSVSSTFTASPHNLSKQVSNPRSGTPDGRQAEENKPLAVSPTKSLSRKAGNTSSPKKSPEKPKSKAWDSLLSFDMNLESGKSK